MDYVRALFSVRGLVIVVYVLIGVFVNTASPHIPHAAFNLAALHSWVQVLHLDLLLAAQLLAPNVQRGPVAGRARSSEPAGRQPPSRPAM